MNFTNPKLVKNWLLIVALIITSFTATQLRAQCVLSTDDLIHISLSDDNCTDTLRQEEFLSDDGAACTVADHYEFEVRSADGQQVLIPMTQNAILDNTYIGGPYMLIIQAHDAAHNVLNTAMTTFDVADKMPPTINCPDTMEIACWQDDATLLTPLDNCSNAHLVWTDESVVSNDCSAGPGGLNWPFLRFKQISRTYVAVDASGNKSDPCEVVLNVNAYDYWNGAFPNDSLSARIWGVPNLQRTLGNAISCKDADSYKDANGVFDPDKTGWPELIYWDENPTVAELAAGDRYDTVAIDNSCKFNCNLASTYIDIKVNTCPECIEKVLRMWSVVETNCDPNNYNSVVFVDAQIIEVVDTISPVIICPENDSITTNTIGNFAPVSAGDIDCGAWYTFPLPQMSDECSSHLTWTISVMNDMGTPVMFADTNMTKTPVQRQLPFGVNTVTYTVYDNCGNKDSCEWLLKVVDHTPPVAICQQNTTVSLTYDGEAEIPAIDFNSGSYDDCAIDRFKVRRMDNKIDCEGHTDNLWHDYVTFCCDDIANNDITVIMRVWDKGNKWNECMVQVNVQDKLPPQITCPPSLCVECDYAFELDHMENYFGTVVQGYENRETHTLFGNKGAFYLGLGDCGTPKQNLKFKDGWAHDNCGLTITSTYDDYRDQCNNGNIVRKFTAADPNGSIDCYQTIHFYNPHPFNEKGKDIHWPNDTTIVGCFNEAAYGPDVTGWPVLNEDACDLAAASSPDDDVFHFNDDEFDAEGVCFKIIRHWTVMDWCQRYPVGHPKAGQFVTWTWDQVIMISEYTPPVFTSTCEDKETCTYDTECKDGYIELTMSAHDDCTTDPNLKWRYRIYDYNPATGSFDKLIKDSKNFAYPHNIISGPSANASGTYAIGKHRIVWTVWDQCGNTATCDRFFTIKNCKKPTPICIDHISVEMMPVDQDSDGVADWAMITVGPQLVEHCCNKSYHPCGYPLIYSFSSDITDTLRTYDCDTKGLQPVEMWVTAIVGKDTLQDNCVTQIDFQDNNNVCPATPSQSINVKGTVTTIEDDPIPGAEIDVQGSELTPQTTNADGTFAFSVDANRNYIVAPSKDGDDLDGITTLDLVLIQKHLLELKKIDNPYILIAANVNHDSKISASDILLLRKMILGSINDMGDSWLFINKDYQFENPNKPYNEHLPTEVAFNSENDLNIDFYGIKMGDINNSLELRSADKLVFAVDASNNISKGEVEIPVYADNFNSINGFQYTVKFDNSILNFENIEAGSLKLNNSNIGTGNINKGILTMSWDNANGKSVSADQVLFTLKFKANSNAKLQDVISLTSDITKKEAYNADLEVMNVELNFRNAETNEFELYQNSPNPFSEYTDISFNLPENSEGTLSIYDLNGKLIKVINDQYVKGMNSIRIKKSDLNVSGVLYYRFETDAYTATKKMILIK